VLGVDVLERAAYVRGDRLRRLDRQCAMADEPNGHLVLELAPVRFEQLERLVVVVLGLDRPDVGAESARIRARLWICPRQGPASLARTLACAALKT
jgi:hypothetical protein